MELLKFDSIGESVYCETLENGLSVYVFPKKGFDKKFAGFAVNYGGADVKFRCGGEIMDTPAGIAHFLEHKMFDMPDGSNTLAKLASNGASPNAMTSIGMTDYYFSSADHFEENLRILLEYVSTPYFTKESVEKEQGIIGQEIRMIEDEPGYRVYMELMRCLYEHNPIVNGVAGTVESISHITDETLYACHKIFYTPSNMVLCVAGDVDPQRVCDIAREILPKEKNEVPGHEYGEKEEPTVVKPSSEVKMAVSMPQFMIGVKLDTPEKGEAFLRGTLVAELTGNLIAGKSSPLYQKLYKDGLVNSDFSVGQDTIPGGMVLLFAGESREVQKVYGEIKLACEKFILHGVEDGYFERIKKSLAGRMIRSLNSLSNLCYNQVDGYINGYNALDSVRVLMSLSQTELREFAANNLVPERMAISTAIPSDQ